MSLTSRSFRRTLAPVFLLAALLSPLPLAAWPSTAPFYESIESFVRNAYAGVGISPGCLLVQSENATLESLLPTTSSGFEAEARRFVSTLFETQYSYTNYSSTTSPYLVETTYYSSRNPIPDQVYHLNDGNQNFVIDLYHAFLQREYDSTGLTFWTGNANGYANDYQGRRAVLDAFGTIPDDDEFKTLVHSLTDGGGVCCPVHCPSGKFFDCDLGYCVDD
ncbi:MAG TPA: DUF4214 domain-containing protein [Thermoanaerobaculia bacterium]|jgi:hypothetical protein|nr:DUF4214 domain-containing protein [Thermoanaerobaculia bacterium]